MSYFLRNVNGSGGDAHPASSANASPTAQHHSAASSRAMSAYSPLNNNTSNINSRAGSLDAATTGVVPSPRFTGGGNNTRSATTTANATPPRGFIFNDLETHDIVIVAAGDRGLSGTHNEALQQHTQHGGCSGERGRRNAKLHLQQHQEPSEQQQQQHFHMEFYAHKEVLSACSEFFRAFFHDENMHKLLSADKQHQKPTRNSDRFEPCRRLVVHNALPASLAHVLQSMYAAYNNGSLYTDDGVPLYDPVTLSSSPISVIVCAWELCMKLGLRAAAASATHMLIPMVAADSALEVLKATTKYPEHEFSIVLQRACVHARALPPPLHTESERRLWAELCDDIPWLSSTAELALGDNNTSSTARQSSRGAQQHLLQLTGRKQAQAALLARRRQKWLESVDAKKSAAAFGEDEDELRMTAEADEDDEQLAVAAMMNDGNESVGASTQRAWEETQSQCAGNDDDQQEQRDNLDAYPVREYHDDDDARATAAGGARRQQQQQHQQQQEEELVLDADEEEEQRAPPFQRDVNRRMLGVDSRLTPVPLSSVEALCLHSDRSGSNPTLAAARNHHAVAASSTTLRLTGGAGVNNGSTANGTVAKRSFVPAGSTAAAEAARSGRFAAAAGGSNAVFVDPNSPAGVPRGDTVLKHSTQLSAINTTSMADALRSRDAAIRVTATRTVLRDAMNKSGGSAAVAHPFSPTADLPFSSDKRSPDSRTASSAAQQADQDQHLFVERALPTFEQRFVSTRFGDHRKNAQQQQQPQQKHLLANNSGGGDGNNSGEAEDEDSSVARHKIASLEKDIQNTYDLYAKEMAEYRAAYEGLRKETTELWAGTGLVEVGNVPASVQVARDMYARLLEEQQEEDRVRAQMVGALGAIAAQADEERRFAAYAEQFMQAAGIAVEDLGGLLEQARSLLDEYNRFVLVANQQQQQQQRSSSAVAALGAEKAERFRTVRRALEIHVDEAIRRVADEEREAGARLRAHELTLEQLREDVRAEERRLQAARVGGTRSGSSKLRR